MADEKEPLPIEIASKGAVNLGDLVVLDAQKVAAITKLDEDTFTAQSGFDMHVRHYVNSIILKQDRTGYLVGRNLS